VVKLTIGLIALIIFVACMILGLPSLIIEMPITMIRGAHAVKGLIGEIILMERRIAITRKYTLAKRLNCSMRASG
jgi:hypothetical protein